MRSLSYTKFIQKEEEEEFTFQSERLLWIIRILRLKTLTQFITFFFNTDVTLQRDYKLQYSYLEILITSFSKSSQIQVLLFFSFIFFTMIH